MRYDEKKKTKTKANLNWDLIDKMLAKGSFATEIAAKIGVHPDTLYNRCKTDKNSEFSAYAQQKRSIGDISIREKQFDIAVEEGNVTMLIWLGKIRLGQTETQALSTDAPKQDQIEAENLIMLQKNEIADLKKTNEEILSKLNAIQNQS